MIKQQRALLEVHTFWKRNDATGDGVQLSNAVRSTRRQEGGLVATHSADTKN